MRPNTAQTFRDQVDHTATAYAWRRLPGRTASTASPRQGRRRVDHTAVPRRCRLLLDRTAAARWRRPLMERTTRARSHPQLLHNPLPGRGVGSRRATALLGAALVLGSLVAVPAAAMQRPGPEQWADSARTEIQAARIHNDLQRMRAARATVERAIAAYPEYALLLHYNGYALFREAELLRARQAQEDEIRQRLEAAAAALERSAELEPMPETYALYSGALGQQIGFSPFILGIRLGPRSGEAMDRALELGPNNPRVWLLRGIGAMFTPGMFGGGLDKAEQYLEHAIDLFPDDRPAPPAPAWGYADAYAWLGQVHQTNGDLEAARAAYEAALRIEPDYAWVRGFLLPGLERAESSIP